METLSTRSILGVLRVARQRECGVTVSITSDMGARRSFVLPSSLSRHAVQGIIRDNTRDLIVGADRAREISIGTSRNG